MGLTLTDGVINTEIRRQIGLQDVIKKVPTLKENWTGHIARIKDNRWTKCTIEWMPREYAIRSRRQPPQDR